MAKKGITPEDIKIRELARVANYRRVFSTEDGKRIMEDLKQRFYDDELFVRNDPTATSYNVGMRDVVMYINNSVTDGLNTDLGEEIE